MLIAIGEVAPINHNI